MDPRYLYLLLAANFVPLVTYPRGIVAHPEGFCDTFHWYLDHKTVEDPSSSRIAARQVSTNRLPLYNSDPIRAQVQGIRVCRKMCWFARRRSC